MNFDNILQLAALSTLIIGVAGILVKITGYRRQINASLFIEYASRYDDIMMSFPREAWAKRFADGDQIPEEDEEITVCVYRFLHFLSGAHYFHKKGYLEHDAWQLWEAQIRKILQSPLFRREWQKFSAENLLAEDFRLYIETVQNQK